MDGKTYKLFFKTVKEKTMFLDAVGVISEKDFATMCKISLAKSCRITAEVYQKAHSAKMSVELTEEELRCLTIYFGRNPTELTPLSDLHNRFLLVARKAGFEVEKPIWGKPKNAVKFTDEELRVFKKLFGYAGWRNFLLHISPEENKIAKDIWDKFLKLFEEKKARDEKFEQSKVQTACSQDFMDEEMAKKESHRKNKKPLKNVNETIKKKVDIL